MGRYNDKRSLSQGILNDQISVVWMVIICLLIIGLLSLTQPVGCLRPQGSVGGTARPRAGLPAAPNSMNRSHSKSTIATKVKTDP